ncbi:Hsp20/alpha crystallin family protein [Albidovulum sp.]
MTTQTVTRRDGQPAATATTRIFRPLTDIVETREGVHIFMEMPGVAAEDVEIDLEQRILNVRGRVHPKSPETFELVHAEYAEGDYERAFSLGEEVDADRIEARMQDGVLSLFLPRSEEAKVRRIEVKAG